MKDTELKSIRMEKSLIKKVKDEAIKESRTFTNMVNVILSKYLSNGV